MAISNINRISGPSTTGIQQDKAAEQKGVQRQEQQTTETFERGQSITLKDGDTALIPTGIGANEASRIQTFVSGLSTEQTQALKGAAQSIASQAQAAVAAGGDLSQLTSALSKAGSDVAQKILVTSTGIDEKALGDAANTVMAFSMGEIDAKLLGLAGQVKGGNAAKRDLRESMTELREEISDPNAEWPQEFTWNEFSTNDAGKLTSAEKTGPLTKAEAEALLETLEGQLLTVGEQSAMWQLDLQSAMQKQSEIMNIMTAILKQMHDTMSATIRNVKA
jgi:hypothetical protein